LDDARKFIHRKLSETINDPFSYFYLTIKLHKTPISTRPICSDCASLPHALGQWVDEQLQPIVKGQSTYFKNSFDLKKDLGGITLPANALIFTYDALSMYTNIDTEECIARIEQYLWLPATHFRFYHKHPRVIIAAMALVMRNNRMRFGDLVIHQIKGIDMGMLPTPTIANLFVAIYEAEHIVPKIGSYLLLLRRFIDDGIGVWLHDPNPVVVKANWTKCQALVNAMGLSWEFTARSQKVVFMDLTIEIVNRRFVTSLYAKPMALYLYIPPNSSHAPGTLTGLVYSQVLLIYQLCSLSTDINKELATFYRRLLARGYHPRQILPLFEKAIYNVCAHLSRTDEEKHFIAQAKEKALQQ
jgi:hypothetical protein